MTWNDDHQLTQATVTRHGVTQTTRYAYDALGRRVTKTDAFGSTHYLWDGDLMIHSQRGNKEALFIFEPNSFVPLATVQGISKDKESQQTYWYQCDQIGAPQELTDAQGNIVWAADYKVWGEAKLRAIDWPKTGTDGGPARGKSAWHTGASGASSASSRSAPPPIEQPFRFQGQQFDEETGLHYNRARYYDPAIGRFVSQDPIGLRGGQHLSVYAPNPLTLSDPLGLDYRSTFWDAVGGLGREKYQVHHIIPQAIYDKHAALMSCAGIGKDEPDNMIGLPKKQEYAGTRTGRYFGVAMHNTSHPAYSRSVDKALTAISKLPSCAAKKAGAKAIQETLREALRRQGNPVVKSQGSTEAAWDDILR